MKLRFTLQAVNELAEIADHIRRENPRASSKVRAAILHSLELLTSFPKTGRLQSVEDVRKLVVRRYPYLVYYRADEATDEIVILAIRHPARERPFSDR